MGDVIHLTLPHGRRKDAQVGGCELQMLDRENRKDELEARVLSRIRERRWTSPRDRLQIAKNLWDVLHAPELASAGKKPADVLIDAKKSNTGDSTKRHNHYAITSDLTHDEA